MVKVKWMMLVTVVIAGYVSQFAEACNSRFFTRHLEGNLFLYN